MIIYPQEISDGLESKILALASTKISAKINVVDAPSLPTVSDLIEKAFASQAIKPSPDELFYFENILVSAGWNSNDDIFTKADLWAARKTPLHKPLNVEHNDARIIGHTVSCIPVDADYQIIDDDVEDEDDLPDLYHIKAGDVIYRTWHDGEFESQIAQLVEQIRNGEWSVSMECAFKNFDYGMKSDKESFVVKRDASTANITKHLRMFGGDGEYEGYRVGRVLRKLKFSGKGVVRQPANPYSIIFNNFDSVAKKLVYINNDKFNSSNGDNFMSEELKAYASENAKLSKDLVVAEGKLEIAKERADSLNKTIASLNSDVETVSKDRDSWKTKASELEDKLTKLQKELDTTLAQKTDLDSKFDKLNKSIALQSRKNKLVAALVDAEVEDAATKADEFCAKHADKSDDVYAELEALYLEAAKAKCDDMKKEKAKKGQKGQVNTHQAKSSQIESDDVNIVEDESESVESEDEDEIKDFSAASMAFANWMGETFNRNVFKKSRETK